MDDRQVSLIVPEIVPVGHRFPIQTISNTQAGVFIQEGSGVTEIPTADDVVSIEDGSCEVTGHRHSDRFGYTRSNQVPDGSSAEVVRNASGITGL